MKRPIRLRFFLPASLLLVALSVIGWDYEQIFARITTLYRPDMQAQWRLQEWRSMLDNSQALEQAQKLETINTFFNQRLRFSDDIDIWGQVDYWASPAESMVKGAAHPIRSASGSVTSTRWAPISCAWVMICSKRAGFSGFETWFGTLGKSPFGSA